MAVHGGNTEEIARKYKLNPSEIIDFSANINPLGISENVKKAMIDAIDKVVKYPDITYFDLKNSIGEFEKINTRNITLGNGAAEVIFNIVRALKPKKALLPAPTFSEYEEAILSIDGEIEYYNLKESKNFNLDNEFIGNIKNNIDIVDLEQMARNTGSVFGFITYDDKPPSQKTFETRIFESLYFSKTDFLFIESESKRVGHVLTPNNIYDAIVRDGYHILLECSLENRVKRLCRDYVYNKDENNLEVLKDCINKFRKRLGHNKVDEYINLLEEGKYEELVEKYLVEYYDPLYMHSVDKYKYNEVINFDNVDVAVEEVIKFHKSAMEGAIKC